MTGPSTSTLLIAAAIVGWALVHLAFAVWFRVIIVGRRRAQLRRKPAVEVAGKASVLMSLRGCDPSLGDNLRSLLEQSYDDYEVIVIVDSREDPAWSIVDPCKSRFDLNDRMRVEVLREPLKTCSLKCSSLVQAMQAVDSKSQYVVLIDADVVPRKDWLREAIAPLEDTRIGAVTGNQWFAPADAAPGSLIRSQWNCAVMVSTAISANPWAGTCAMRAADVRRSGLIERWKTSAVDDGPIKGAMRQLKLDVLFDPRLMNVNQDRCSLGFASRYATRMLTWSRIFERSFWPTVFHAVLMLAVMMLTVGALIRSVAVGQWLAAATVLGAWLVANSILLAGYRTVESAVAAAITPAACQRMPLDRVPRMFLLIPLCQLGHVVWTLSAIFSRQTSWREIRYRIHPKQRIEMIAYQPYGADSSLAHPSQSI